MIAFAKFLAALAFVLCVGIVLAVWLGMTLVCTILLIRDVASDVASRWREWREARAAAKLPPGPLERVIDIAHARARRRRVAGSDRTALRP